MLWEEIKTQEDIDRFQNKVWGFHDGCFRELHVWSGTFISERGLKPADEGLNAKVLFHGCKRNEIFATELHFTDILRINVPGMAPKSAHIISDSTLKHEDGVFYWADVERWDIKDPNSDEILWIAAKGLKWRDRSEWMGDTLRYGTDY